MVVAADVRRMIETLDPERAEQDDFRFPLGIALTAASPFALPSLVFPSRPRNREDGKIETGLTGLTGWLPSPRPGTNRHDCALSAINSPTIS
jgi:hypothetical protein